MDLMIGTLIFVCVVGLAIYYKNKNNDDDDLFA